MTTEDKTTQAIAAYSEEQIQVLEGLEPVRRRPGMYIGSTGIDGLHHLVTEIVNNSMDEAIAGFANHIKLEFFKDGSVAVYDNGRGIPYGIKAGYGVSALELAYTRLHAGGKFGGSSYKVSSGLHGVGSSVVNALSEWCRVIVTRGDETVMQEYANGGEVLGPVAKIDRQKPKTKVKDADWLVDLAAWNYPNGTIVQFMPDATIFETTNFAFKHFLTQLKEYAYLTAGIKFELIDHRTVEVFTYYFEGGIKTFLKNLNTNKKVHHVKPFYIKKELDRVLVETVFQYNDTFNETVLCFANHLKNSEGGTHLTGFRSALTKTINDYARKKGYLKENDENLSGDDVKEGLTAIISVKLDSAELQFEGQTKAKLGNTNVRQAVETVVKDALDVFFEENPREAQAIVEKNVVAMKARIAAKAARDTVIRKSALEGGGVLPGKLADCQEKDSAKTEIFIVEGDSAGGCFGGDVLVALANGRNLSFEDLVEEDREGKQNFCYTIKADGTIGLAPVKTPRMTKASANIVEVALDNNESIKCTSDHLFMTRDGNYIKAGELKAGMSLMPLRRELSRMGRSITIEGYELVFDPGSYRWLFTHMLSDQYNLKHGIYKKERGEHRHHEDFNKLNNNPTNITRLDREEHQILHSMMAEKTILRSDIRDKVRKIQQTPEYKAKVSKIMSTPKMRKMLSKRAKKQWENPKYKARMIENFRKFYTQNEGYRKENSQMLDEAQMKYWGNKENREKQANRVRKFFIDHPKRKAELGFLAINQWKDPELVEWRKNKTKEQWTDDFREKRLKAYNQTYLTKALAALHELILQKENETDLVHEYNQYRRIKRDKSLLRFDTIKNRFFDGSAAKLLEAVANHNHRVKSVRHLDEKIPVYDLEVDETHNFALASGVFVHNSAKAGRDRKIQAILPLFGKPLNSERARLDKIVGFDRFRDLITAIGAGIGESYNPARLRYGKIIIMSDADVDGAHIQTLYLTFFFRHMVELIDAGHIFLSVPPLYKASWGKEKKYLFDDTEREEFIKTDIGKKAIIQRFKGLGEMNAEELWETTMNPETRKLKKISVEDGALADEVFTMLMGDDVAPRKKFIQTHAKQANVDIT
ncbi:MAG: gyrase subunit B protein [candidate division WWE3 bacterium GW2011_GWC2_44_9]|uniref:DNA topoisomerase (ATP-hydrolyzing) n=1 Tax=candidate division WWE3 bacterium GW2011_GWC2_44_9 TaxID=1619125 RepID=A0A0G1NJK4_UNCKA|nr:MAG: gyrase subunit B protein [candidate division WWE3 bacterium GW2011_GWC2_44_9]